MFEFYFIKISIDKVIVVCNDASVLNKKGLIMEELVYNMLKFCGVIAYIGFGIETWFIWENALLKKRYHLFWYFVFLPVTLSFSAGKWLYNFMKKDL